MKKINSVVKNTIPFAAPELNKDFYCQLFSPFLTIAAPCLQVDLLEQKHVTLLSIDLSLRDCRVLPSDIALHHRLMPFPPTNPILLY